MMPDACTDGCNCIHCGTEFHVGEVEEELARLRGDYLPDVLLTISGDVFSACSGPDDRYEWSIKAEAEQRDAARTMISVDGKIIADVTIHALHESQLPDEVQSISAALLWSALRCEEVKNAR